MKRTLKNLTLKNIAVIFLIPAILSGTLYLFSSYKAITKQKSVINTQFSQKLSEFTKLNKQLTGDIFQDFPNISAFSAVQNILAAGEQPERHDKLVTDAQSILNLYKQKNPMVYSVGLINYSANFVLTESGLYPSYDYFTKQNIFKNYDYDFWRSLQVRRDIPKLLDASELISDTPSKIIIPYVVNTSQSIDDKSYILVELDLEYVYNTLRSQEYSSNAQIFLMNNSDYRCLSKTGLIDFPFDNQNLKQKITNNNIAHFNSIKIEGTEYYLMSASSSNSIYNYSYIVAIPLSDIHAGTQSEYNTFTVTLLIELAILIAAIFIFIFKIYKPLAYINTLTGNTNTTPNNGVLNEIIGYINTSIDEISKLNNRLNDILPATTEHYLFDIINKRAEQNPYLEEKIFNYKYFVPISVEIIFQPKFYEDINMSNLSLQTIDIISTQFDLKFQTYPISKTATTLSFLINLQNTDDINDVEETIKTVYSLFAADNIYISIYFGVGSVIDDLSGLRQSFAESMQQIYTQLTSELQNTTKASQLFGYKEITQFNNYLIAANTQAALDMIDNINSQLLSMPHDIIKTVYSDIILNIHHVMKLKGIFNTNYTYTTDVLQINDICKRTQSEMYEYCVQCIKQIAASSNLNGKKFNIEEVIQYIRDHYTKDISLDALADEYGTYPQYLSKRIKQYLGLNFHDYLSSLRVEKAKELLRTTKSGILEISELSGFFSRNTFLRVFKKYTGITPSEYRKSAATDKTDNNL